MGMQSKRSLFRAQACSTFVFLIRKGHIKYCIDITKIILHQCYGVDCRRGRESIMCVHVFVIMGEKNADIL